jgi:chorismate mutase
MSEWEMNSQAAGNTAEDVAATLWWRQFLIDLGTLSEMDIGEFVDFCTLYNVFLTSENPEQEELVLARASYLLEATRGDDPDSVARFLDRLWEVLKDTDGMTIAWVNDEIGTLV